LREAKKNVQHNLEKLDKLNPRIKKRFERYQEILSEREARRLALLEAQHSEVEGDAISFQGTLESDHVHQLEGGENRELAVQLAQHEMSRRATERKASRPGVISQDEERWRRAGTTHEPDELSRRLQEVRAQVERPGKVSGPSQQRKDLDATYTYPTVPLNHAILSLTPTIPSRNIKSRLDRQPPLIPPKSVLQPSIYPPPLPSKLSTAITTDLSALQDATPIIPPKLQQQLQQQQQQQQHLPQPQPLSPKPNYTFLPSAHLENGTPLRTLFLPPHLRLSFLTLAHSNTSRNLETCAFLAGTLLSNALFVSKLVIPRQTATSDTCEMTHESDLFDYIDGFPDLMILGWIHTHPTQTCFMSSRDLHTHAAYQMMLPESVALVCAPSVKVKTGGGDGGGGGEPADEGGDWGVFRLTDPPGKSAILQCAKPGVFHPHDCANLYTGALRPGHVVEAKGLEFEVVDLRSGS
jgi:STAM-binding protein